MKSEEIMKTKSSYRALVATSILAVTSFVAFSAIAQDQSASTSPKPTTSTTATSAPQGAMPFDTPQQAADAVVKAAADYDVAQLTAIFGPDGKDFISGGDQVQDKSCRDGLRQARS